MQEKKETYLYPSEEFVENANVTEDPRDAEHPECFDRYAELLDWDRKWAEVLDDSEPPFFRWFVGGKLNASRECLDRHLADRGDQVAILWEGEDGEVREFTYRDLHREVNEFAAVLRDIGVEEGDVVTLHLPMLPALPITMLACARIGAVHSEVFAGFSAEALADRMNDAQSRVLVTCDGYYRRGTFLKHLEKADEALRHVDHDVDRVLVWTRNDDLHPGLSLQDDRYVLVDDLLMEKEGAEVEPVSRDSEDPLFLMYTSGTTGKPKGTQHRTGGYLAYVAGTLRDVHDVRPEDTYWCMADIGWITGHSYVVYGPLALGTTSVMFEGAPDHPDKSRTWDIAERHSVDILNTSPTAIRMFMKWGPEWLEGHDFDFRLLGTVGEPIEREAWLWYYRNVGKERAPVVDKWWQTETGGNLVATYPGVDEMKPGAAGKPLMGIEAAVWDDDGEPMPTGEHGSVVILKPWPGMLQTIYGDDERFVETYWAHFSDTDSTDPADWVYEPEDECQVESDGYFRFLGRRDEVMKVAGHRIGTQEIEDAMTEVDEVAEVGVAARKHPEKGEVPDAYVVLRDGVEESKGLKEKLVESVEENIGPIARPAHIYFVHDLPKTRSGKIMRRLLEDISNGEPLGDTTTLQDPDVPVAIRDTVQE